MTRQQYDELLRTNPKRLHLYYEYCNYNVYDLNENWEDQPSYEEWDKCHDDEGRFVSNKENN